MTITPLAGTSQIATALTTLGTTAFGDSETELYTQLLVALSAGGPAPVWTPADIADLAIFFWFKPGVDCAYASNGGAAAGAGDSVGYAAPLFGATISASEATNKPTLQADGLQLGDAGVQLLNLSSPIAGDGAFTAYWSMVYATGSTLAPFATDSALGSFIGANTGGGAIADENSSELVSTLAVDVPALGRADCVSLGGDVTIMTGSGSATTSAFGNFPLSQIGGTGGFGYFNDNVANRFRLLIWINRRIALGSAEDLLIRNWIATNDGTSL